MLGWHSIIEKCFTFARVGYTVLTIVQRRFWIFVDSYRKNDLRKAVRCVYL